MIFFVGIFVNTFYLHTYSGLYITQEQKRRIDSFFALKIDQLSKVKEKKNKQEKKCNHLKYTEIVRA